MNILDTITAIKMEFEASGIPGRGEIDEAINECVRMINNRTPAKQAIITITGTDLATGVTSWNVDDIDVNVDDLDVNVDEMGRFISGFKWDSDGNFLTMPDNIISLKQLFISDIEQIPKPYEKMINETTMSEEFFYLLYGTRITSDKGYFTQFDNKLYFQVDLGAETTVIKMIVEMEYEELSGDVLAVPTYWKQFLISHCIEILGSRSRNVISDRAYARHIALSGRSYKDIINRQISIVQPKDFDIW